MGGSLSLPIEHFLWSRKNQKTDPQDRLLFYDQDGTLIERDIETGSIEEVLKVFDGKFRAVRRSSGGLVAAQPCQVVLVTTDSPARTSVRIRVRFKDLRFEDQNGILLAKPFSHTKVVSPEELREPFTFNYNDTQQFVLDFGNGMMPVYVFHYDTDEQGLTHAFFVEFGELESALSGEPGTRTFIQPYMVPRAVLRYASVKPERDGRSDYDIAHENLKRMRRLGASVVPECLAAGEPVAAPSGASVDDIRDYLQLTVVSHRQSENQSIAPLLARSLVEEEEAESALSVSSFARL